ncbi:MAG: DUF92 domain-containing protein [Anaerolineaceae bacterium]|nr:DUF92 domain-containing protein [Anaerolineaceae bacterium]
MPFMVTFLLGLVVAVLFSGLAYRARSLNLPGALAAAGLGTVVFGLGGLHWAVLLLTFFVSSSALSRLFGKRKTRFNEKFAKGSQRDAAQVLANGGIGGVFVLLHLVFPGAHWPWMGFAGAIAAVNADTWATELGVLSHSIPRAITTGKPVERGTSGGVTIEGTLAAVLGAALIAALAALMAAPEAGKVGDITFLIITLSGLAGSLLDSLLGATLQAIYYCPRCKQETEHHPLHICQNPTALLRGYAWMENDWVNIACALTGALLAVSFYIFL